MSSIRPKPRAARHLGELVARIIEPVTAQRGFARAELVAVWPEIVGAAHAASTAPEKIAWPRTREGEPPPGGTLVVRADGPRAIFLQHEVPQIIERANAFFGYRAIAHVRIVQGAVGARPGGRIAPEQRPDPATERRVADQVGGVEDDGLRAALQRLGCAALTKRRE